jgi:hypothetical protein
MVMALQTKNTNKKAPWARGFDGMAEEVGFEPTRGVNPCQFSRLVLSTAQPPFRNSIF